MSQVLVLGVHRSGTSVLTETVARLGLYAGGAADLDSGDQWNENGYWEHRAIRALDEELLDLAGTDWIGVTSFEPEQLPEASRTELTVRAGSILASLDAHRPWVVKDPRLCVLLPFWLPFLDSPLFLFSLRSPLSVARSLRARNSLPIPVGLALWETQLLAGLAATRGSRRAAFWYEHLVDSPDDEASRLASWLRSQGCPVPVLGPTRAAADRALLHHEANAAEEQHRLPSGPRRLLAALRSGEAFDAGFDIRPSEDARELMEFVGREARTRRFLEKGWKQQRAAHGDAIRILEEMIVAKDSYIADLSRHLDRTRDGGGSK